MSRDVHRALERLEEYHAELIRPADLELKIAIEKILSTFKTSLFHALCDIHDFYETTLLSERLNLTQKTFAARDFSLRWEGTPPFSSTYARSHIPAPATRASYSSTLHINSDREPLLPPVPAPAPLYPAPLSRSSSRFAIDTYPSNGLGGLGGGGGLGTGSLVSDHEIEDIVLDTRSVGLGFSISGGIDRDANPDHLIRVTEILKDGAVARDGRVRINDVILKINNIDVVNVKHQQAVDAINQADGFVRLVVRRPRTIRSLSQSHLNDAYLRREERTYQSSYTTPPPVRSRSLHTLPISVTAAPPLPTSYLSTPAPAPPPAGASLPMTSLFNTTSILPPPSLGASTPLNQSYQSFVQPTPPGRLIDPNATLGLYDPRSIILQKGDQGLGFNIVGGEDNEPIYISHVLPGGVADLSGNVRKGDVLLQVNDIDLRTSNHAQAAMALRGAMPGAVRLTLQYRPREFRDFEDKVERLRQDMYSRNVILTAGGR